MVVHPPLDRRLSLLDGIAAAGDEFLVHVDGHDDGLRFAMGPEEDGGPVSPTESIEHGRKLFARLAH